MVQILEAVDPGIIGNSQYETSLWASIFNYNIPISPRFTEKLVGEKMVVTAIHNVNETKLPGVFKFQNRLNGISCSLSIWSRDIEKVLGGNQTSINNRDIWCIVKGLYNFSAYDDIYSNVTKSGYRTLNIELFRDYIPNPVQFERELDEIFDTVLLKFIDVILKEIHPRGDSSNTFQKRMNSLKQGDRYARKMHLGRSMKENTLLDPKFSNFDPIQLKPVLQARKKLLAELLDKIEDLLVRNLSKHFQKEKQRINELMHNWKLDSKMYDEIVVSRYKVIAIITGHESAKLVNNIDIPHTIIDTPEEFEDAVRKYLNR